MGNTLIANAMSDPLLSALCSICHIEAPKYKCPRCGVRTCSLACVRKHKSWASCSGDRDPAAFVPRTQLRTDAGVDHDYNFIAGIERARERFEKEISDDGRGLLSESDIRGPKAGADDKRFEKVWYGDQLHHVPAPGDRGGYMRGRGRGRGYGMSGNDGRFPSGPDKQVRRRLRAHNIEVVSMPKGLLRQRQNKTAWNRRTNTINWQVEWLVFSSNIPDVPSTNPKGQPLQILYKALDEKPLYQALAGSLDWYRAGIKRARENADEGLEDDPELPPRKKQRTAKRRQKFQEEEEPSTASQDPDSTAWSSSEYTLQYSLTGEWNQTSSAGSVPRTKEDEDEELATLQFYLVKPGPSKDGSKQLIPLSSKDSLAETLSGRTVVEFPTIYVFDSANPLPSSFTMASTERRQRKPEPVSDNENGGSRLPRRGRPFESRRGGRPARQFTRRVAPAPTEDAEEGEVNSEGEQLGADDIGDMIASPEQSCAETDGSCGDTQGPEVLKSSNGLVDYGSSSDSEE